MWSTFELYVYNFAPLHLFELAFLSLFKRMLHSYSHPVKVIRFSLCGAMWLCYSFFMRCIFPSPRCIIPNLSILSIPMTMLSFWACSIQERCPWYALLSREFQIYKRSSFVVDMAAFKMVGQILNLEGPGVSAAITAAASLLLIDTHVLHPAHQGFHFAKWVPRSSSGVPRSQSMRPLVERGTRWAEAPAHRVVSNFANGVHYSTSGVPRSQSTPPFIERDNWWAEASAHWEKSMGFKAWIFEFWGSKLLKNQLVRFLLL
jgi:hypothetical protein